MEFADTFFGLPSFRVDSVEETEQAVRCAVTLITRPACPICGPHLRISSNGKFPTPLVLLDTPSRGLPTELHVSRRRFKCEVCRPRRTFSERGPETHPELPATLRLIRYIENAVTKRPIAHIARETGMSESTVRDLALALSERLEKHHRFPTPRVLAIDGLSLNNREYMVMADASTGRPIGLTESVGALVVRGWIRDKLKLTDVQVLVSDLHLTNISVARHELKHARHVADKWHIISGYQKPLSTIINIEIDRLRKSGQPADAATIVDAKPALMAINPKNRKSKKRRGQAQLQLDFDDLFPILKSYPNIRQAWWGRYDLVQMYKCETEQDALDCLERFHRRVAPFAANEDMEALIKRLKRCHVPIFNYFREMAPAASGRVRGPTTNALEQRNATIRKTWQSGNGIRNHALLRLRVLYQPWRLWSDLLPCSGPNCEVILGPLLGPPIPASLRHLSAPRCAACVERSDA